MQTKNQTKGRTSPKIEVKDLKARKDVKGGTGQNGKGGSHQKGPGGGHGSAPSQPGNPKEKKGFEPPTLPDLQFLANRKP